MDKWTLIRFFHLLAIAFFVGGQIALAVAVVPALRGNDELMRGAARRFGVATGAALAVIIGTGAALASHLQRWGDPTLHAKLGLLALVFILLGLHTATPYTRALSLAVLLTSIGILSLGVNLVH
jgi:putative copper export protein